MLGTLQKYVIKRSTGIRFVLIMKEKVFWNATYTHGNSDTMLDYFGRMWIIQTYKLHTKSRTHFNFSRNNDQ